MNNRGRVRNFELRMLSHDRQELNLIERQIGFLSQVVERTDAKVGVRLARFFDGSLNDAEFVFQKVAFKSQLLGFLPIGLALHR